MFDAKGKTFRSDIYSDYKANRPPMPDELRLQLDPIKSICKAIGFPIVEIEGVEADDVIAILKTVIRNRNYKIPIYIITNDHDYLQLFDDNTYIYNLKGLNLRTKSKGNSKLDLQFKIKESI